MNYKTLVILLFHSTFAFQACNTIKEKKVNHVVAHEEPQEVIEEILVDTVAFENDAIKVDIFHTSLGDLISGQDKSYFDTIISIDSDFWSEFSEEINDDFSKIEHRRLLKMAKWSDSLFIHENIDTSLVFYPFSGPDFLHAYYLYPNASEYILLALEDIGNIPNWSEIGLRETKRYLENANNFLRDIYLRSYFITKHMKLDIKKEEKISGVLPSLYWFLSRTNHELVNVERVTLDVNGKLILRDKEHGIDGVRFYFLKKGSQDIKMLTYFSCDISDDGFEEDNPELLIYLNNMRKCNTFVKSASYLMHYRSFKEIRNVILDKSVTIFQDDTGIPYKYVNNDNWKIRCFGSYVKPIKDFEKNYDIIYQNDLASRYKKGDIERLPFSLGYHWRDASEQNQMLMIKN